MFSSPRSSSASAASSPVWATRKLAEASPGSGSNPLRDIGLKAFALLAKAGPKNAASSSKIANKLVSLPPLSLWQDWVPPRAAPLREVPTDVADPKNAFASSSSKDSSPAKALEASGEWTSGTSSSAPKSWHWGVGFNRPVRLAAISVEFKNSALQYASEAVEVEVSSTEAVSVSQGSKAAAADFNKPAVGNNKISGKEMKGTLQFNFAPQGVACRFLKLNFTGVNAANTESSSTIALARVRIWEMAPVDETTTAAAALGQLTDWLVGLAVSSMEKEGKAQEEAYSAAVKALIGLARASGSLKVLLSLARVLLMAPSAMSSSSPSPSSSSFAALTSPASLSLVEALAAACYRERALQTYRGYFPFRGSLLQAAMAYGVGTGAGLGAGAAAAGALSSGGSGGASRLGLIEGCVWDKDCCSSGVTITEEGKTVRSQDGTYNYCLMALGEDFTGSGGGAGSTSGFTTGKAVWELKLVEDTDSQCSCFGLSTKPIGSPNYDSGTSFWMVRSYNGYRYARGSTIHSTNSTRIYKGNTVRFELDFDDGADGTCKLNINGADQGVVFTGFRGKEVWPAVTFYGSARVVTILSVMGPTKSKAARAGALAARRAAAALTTARGGAGDAGAAGSGSSAAAAGGAPVSLLSAASAYSPAPPVPPPDFPSSLAAPLFQQDIDAALAAEAALLSSEAVIAAPAALQTMTAGFNGSHGSSNNNSNKSQPQQQLGSALITAARAGGLIDSTTGSPALDGPAAIPTGVLGVGMDGTALSTRGGMLGLSSVGMVLSHYLADLKEHHASGLAAGASLGRGQGDLGYSTAPTSGPTAPAPGSAAELQSRKVKVNGTTGFDHSISLFPSPATTTATATAATMAATATTGAADQASALSSSSSSSSDLIPNGSQEDADERRERLLRAAQQESKQSPSFNAGGAASTVFWLGKKYEGLSGAVALNDSATTELRSSNEASPLFFELYGDSKLLWRSEPVHAAKALPQPFAVRVLGVEVLRLVVRCLGGNAGAHAVWLDPRLTMVSEWCHNGWRNDRETFADDLTGLQRGKIEPLPAPEDVVRDPLPLRPSLAANTSQPEAAMGSKSNEEGEAESATERNEGSVAAVEPADSASLNLKKSAFLRQAVETPEGLATVLLSYLGLLAKEQLKALKNATIIAGPISTRSTGSGSGSGEDKGGPAAVESPELLEAPYCLEPTGQTVQEIASILSSLLPSTSTDAAAVSVPGGKTKSNAASAAALLTVLTANLRKAAASRLSPLSLGLSSSSSSSSSSPSAGAGGGKGGSSSSSPPLTLSPVLAALADRLYKSASWGGDAKGRKLVGGGAAGEGSSPASAASAASAAGAAGAEDEEVIQTAIWELLDAASGMLSIAGGKTDSAASRQERLRLIRAVAGGPGVVELQLQWPCDEGDDDGALVQLETLLLQTQLWASGNKAKCRLFGKWPARVYLVIELNGASASANASASGAFGVKDWLDGPFTSMLASLELKNWWWAQPAATTAATGSESNDAAPSSSSASSSSSSTAEGSEIFPVKLERDPFWDRRARGAVEGGIGAVRVYPAYSASFDKVCEGIDRFLPKEA